MKSTTNLPRISHPRVVMRITLPFSALTSCMLASFFAVYLAAGSEEDDWASGGHINRLLNNEANSHTFSFLLI